MVDVTLVGYVLAGCLYIGAACWTLNRIMFDRTNIFGNRWARAIGWIVSWVSAGIIAFIAFVILVWATK